MTPEQENNNEQQAQQTVASYGEQPPVSQPPVSQQPPAAPMPPQDVGDKHDPKSRLAMMLFAFFAAPSGLARGYIGETSGMVRFWIYIPTAFLSAIPFVNFLAAPVMLVLYVWGLVDFFLLKGRQQDAHGAQMYSTNRDERVINYLYIVFIILIAISILAVIAAIFVIVVGGIGSFSFSDYNSDVTPYSSSY